MNPLRLTPKDFFLQIGVMVALYVSAISLIALLFQVINVLHPDQLYSYVDIYSTGIRWAIASLIIVFPLCLLLAWLLERDFRAIPEKRGNILRRWLTFLTLFIAGAAIATDLIILINSFLGGEYTTRFILKILVVLVVAGFVFGYNLWDLKRSAEGRVGKAKYFAIVAAILVLASVVGGFAIMGSPKTQRSLHEDQRKVTELQSIQWQVINYWQQKGTLPNQLSDLQDPLSSYMVPREGYEYRKLADLKFELCASFNLESRPGSNNYYGDYSMTYPVQRGYENENWQHGVGRTCFERTIDPQLYPPVTAKPRM